MTMEESRGNISAAAGQFTREKNYWFKQLTGDWVKGSVPYDFNRASGTGEKGETRTLAFQWDDEVGAKLWKISGQSDRRLFMILVTGMFVLLEKYSGNKDITIGAPILKQEVEADFINTMVTLRTRLEPGIAFKDLLMTVKDIIIAADENQNYPVSRLSEQLWEDGTGSGFHLFETVVLLENIHDKKYIGTLSPVLTVSFNRNGEGIAVVMDYDAGLYEPGTLERMARHLQELLRNAAQNITVPTDRVELMSPREKNQVLIEFNSTAAEKCFSGTIAQLFQQQAARTPDNIAVTFNPGGSDANETSRTKRELTYDALDKKSNQLARLLRKDGVQPGDVVGVLLEPSEQMIAALLAILKTGAAYLPIDSGTPKERVIYMLENAGARSLIADTPSVSDIPFVSLQDFDANKDVKVVKTPTRIHIKAFDQLPRPDRSFVNLQNYRNKIGMASVTNCMSIQTTRGCPYECLYCHKIWAKTHVYRSPENIYEEVEYYYKNGVTNFAFIDDCFNLNKEKSSRFFKMVTDNKLNVQLFFPNGLRGDIMTPDYIDRMVEAGTRGINLSLETASPRLQKLLKKHLNLERFKEVMDYIAVQHPRVILEMASMHGFPGETEEEAMMTLDFIKSIKWLHFPYIHILKIFPNTEMEEFALEQGISKEAIMVSKDRAFHELPETLPFPKSFTRKYQADFLNEYFLNKERLQHVLPHQMRVLSETALAQKYNAYLPTEIKTINDVIQFAGLEGVEIPEGYGENTEGPKSIFDRPIEIRESAPGAKKLLFLDLSQHFSSHSMLYSVVEQPLGALYLATYLKERYGDRIDSRVYKSGNDFDSFDQLKQLVMEFQPDLVGIRTLTFFRDFFHETVAMLRQWGVDAPIITGGPYASSDYDSILKDKNIDLVVFGEGEYTLAELMDQMFKYDFTIPPHSVLEGIAGLAYAVDGLQKDSSRSVFLLDRMADRIASEDDTHLDPVPGNDPGDAGLAYVMYTSGSTGRPKGVMVEHRQVNTCISWMQDKWNLNEAARIINRTNLTFDPSVWEIFWPLYLGGSVKVLDNYQRKDAEYLIRLMVDARETGDTMMYCPATMVNMMTYLLNSKDSPPPLTLPWLLIGAEPISMEIVKNFYRYYEGNIVNTYGPTECTINNTFYDLTRDDPRAIVPIGQPVDNNRIYILDSRLQPMPVKIPGELYIGGDSVARGYINDREKTEAGFIENPFGQGKLFNSGDIARWCEDGTIEIMGRIDEQVKIRGYRIEPGEIENVISSYPSVNECIVVVKDAAGDEKKIKTCKICGIDTRYPNIDISPESECSICTAYKENKQVIDNYFQSPEELKELLQEARKRKKGKHDCLMIYNGGRGAAHALYRLKDMGFDVMCLTYDNGYFSKMDLERIKKVTDSLGFDHEIIRHKNSTHIMGESVKTAGTVCRGCFHVSSSIAGEYAYRHGIPVTVGATLSRGQIIENKLLMFLQQGITDIHELETQIAGIQKSAPEIDKNIFDYIDLDVVSNGTVQENVKSIDFYRYWDITNADMIRFLDDRDPYWQTRKNYAVYSTNCPIKQIGDFGHLQLKGFHYYGGATSWEVRLGHITVENLKEDLQCRVSRAGYESFLQRIGYYKEKAPEKPDKYLCAYLVSGTGEKSSELVPGLRTYLAERLPVYMVPEFFVVLDKIPLDANGKVDKKALPEPERGRTASSATYVEPSTDMEVLVAQAWKEVLGVDMVGTKDNFFDLGGNSMDIVMVGSNLKKTIEKDIPAVTLFTYPTIGSLAEHLEAEGGATREEVNEVDRSEALAGGKGRLRKSMKRRRGKN